MHQPLRRLCSAAALASVLITLGGCEVTEPSAEPTAAPPPQVGVMELQARDVTLSTEVAGRTTPYLIAEVRPQVGGIVRKRLFEEGSEVEAGQVLYRIDPATYLALAALYESWSVPFSVMLVVPLGILGAVLATSLRGLENDVYFQVGLLTTVGLAAKNAILIVEFAKALHERGKDLLGATLEAARIRLRPILMTSLAFGFGVLPLALSTGAGSGSQNAIGTSVLGGMLAATLLGIFYVPLFFVLVKRYPGGRRQVASDIDRAPALDLAEVNHS